MTTWRQRLAAAQKRGKFTKNDKRLAMGFRQCAIGEKFHLQDMKEPPKAEVVLDRIGPHAYDLGVEFYMAVGVNDIEHAMKTYARIQKLRVKK